MGSRGVHFAVEPSLAQRLVDASDDELVEIIQEEVEEAWDENWLHETDKAWDAIHRCLTDGKLEWENGTYPLNAAILGGERLYAGDDYIVCLVRPDQVKQVGMALRELDHEFFVNQYKLIAADEYPDLGAEDLEYTWNWFQGLPELFLRAADAGRAVIFTADQ